MIPNVIPEPNLPHHEEVKVPSSIGASINPNASVPSQPENIYPPEKIKKLMQLGVTKEQAINSLKQYGGDETIAANMLFVIFYFAII